MDLSWLTTENLAVTRYADPDGGTRLLVSDAGRRWAAILRVDDDGILTVNGEVVNTGDDYPAILGLVDEATILPAETESFMPAPDSEPSDDVAAWAWSIGNGTRTYGA